MMKAFQMAFEVGVKQALKVLQGKNAAKAAEDLMKVLAKAAKNGRGPRGGGRRRGLRGRVGPGREGVAIMARSTGSRVGETVAKVRGIAEVDYEASFEVSAADPTSAEQKARQLFADAAREATVSWVREIVFAEVLELG